MKKIPQKNYYILAVLIFLTILLTLSLANVYINKDKYVSNFYKYSNKITYEEFDEYVSENFDLIIYISDKYDLSHERFENNFKDKLNDLNLKNKLVYIDKGELNKKFLKKLKNEYGINIDINKLPTIVVIVDSKVIKNVVVAPNSDVDTIIKYEVFE
jgi:hypothetical protein